MARLHTLARHGDYDGAALCIANGADVNAVSPRHFTPLMLAAQNGFRGIVRLLLNAGADVNIAHPNGRRAIHLAAAEGHLEVVTLLADQRADLDAASKIGCTPMIEAAMWNHHEVVSYLKARGADPAARCGEGLTADEWQAAGGLPGWMETRMVEVRKKAEQRAAERHELFVRQQMADGQSPEEYVATTGRFIIGFSNGYVPLSDPEQASWDRRVGELLSNPELIAQCEEQHLSGAELEDARKRRARKQRMLARMAARKARWTGEPHEQ